MMRTMKAGLVVAVAVAIAACGSTSFQSTWKAPDAGPLQLEEGTKVFGMVVSGNTAKRRGMEAALVNELNEHGLEGIAAYSVIPQSMAQDAAKAKPYVVKSGAAYALILQVTGSEQQITGTPSMTGAGMWGAPGVWGPGRAGMGWGWGGGTDIRTDTLVGVQTLLYDVKADKLVWAGQSETMNPSKAESFVRELVNAVGDELQKDGLVGPPKS
jgi:hypothetical protein